MSVDTNRLREVALRAMLDELDADTLLALLDELDAARNENEFLRYQLEAQTYNAWHHFFGAERWKRRAKRATLRAWRGRAV